MNHKKTMLTLLAQAGELLSERMSPEEVMESNLLNAWLQQVASALKAAGMTDQFTMWDEVRRIQVTLNKKIGLDVYATSMRALLLGFLESVEDEDAT
jgi:hypothetical protein